MKKFWLTSEFWVSALTIVGATASAIAGIVPVAVGAGIASVGAAAYTLARGLAKSGLVKDK